MSRPVIPRSDAPVVHTGSVPGARIRPRRTLVIGTILVLLGATPLTGQRSAVAAQTDRSVFLDKQGVVRWKDTREEVTLFGANYVLPTASDYRAAGYVHGDRKRMIEEDMAQFARMGWDGVRLTFWGDWEASDSLGNLIENDHLDLLDWLIARGRERGIYFLFSPIQLYSANWPDALQDTTDPGFGRRYPRDRMGTDSAAIRAQVNYLRQILRHVNPYTGTALKDEPSILFIELVNEPVHHPEDLDGSVRYINTLSDAVRGTGCNKLIFYNVSQDFRIGAAIRRSRAQGVTFGWYPTGLNSGHELRGNYLRGVDTYPDMLRPELEGMPRIVYEFDSPDLRNGTMYPGMARTFRSVGGQVALMFAYDMQATASRNLGWQTHYLSLAYTPRKAVSAMIAAEVMHRLPARRSWGTYPGNNRFGDFRISPDENLSELLAHDRFMHAGTTRSTPPAPAALEHIVGYGSSPLVRYEGEGVYFLDRLAPGVWRLEVYPDAVPVRDPFEAPNAGKVVTRAISRTWPMTIRLPDLGGGFWLSPVGGGTAEQAREGEVSVRPGVYLLGAGGPVDRTRLPARVGRIGLDEYHPPPADTMNVQVDPLGPQALVLGGDYELRVRIAEPVAADSVTLFLRRTAGDFYRAFPMHRVAGYEYAVTLPRERALRASPHEFVVTRYTGDTTVTYPAGIGGSPWRWDYWPSASWPLEVVERETPLILFEPGDDAPRLTFTRIGDAGRRGLFAVTTSAEDGRPVFHLELPTGEERRPLPDYTASLIVLDRVRDRGAAIGALGVVRVRARGLGARETLHLTLMEDDGTSWTAPIELGQGWQEFALPVTAFTAGRGVLLPQGFPGQWNYWVAPAAGRGGRQDGVRLERLERLQLSLRSADLAGTGSPYGVEVAWVRLDPGTGR